MNSSRISPSRLPNNGQAAAPRDSRKLPSLLALLLLVGSAAREGDSLQAATPYPKDPLYETSLGYLVRGQTAPVLAQDGTVAMFGQERLFFLSGDRLSLRKTLYLGYASREMALASPIIGHDGMIYMALNGTAQPNLLAIDPRTMDVTWRINLQKRLITKTPAMAPNGLLIVAASDVLHGIDPRNGRVAWARAMGNITAAPVVRADNVALVGTTAGLKAMDIQSGEILWTADVGNRHILEPPAIGHRGEAYVVTTAGSLEAIGPDGSRWWGPQGFSGTNPFSPTVAADGSILVVCSKSISAFSPNGRMQWDHTLDNKASGPATIGHDGRAYVLAARYFYRFDIGSGAPQIILDLGAGPGADSETTPLLTARGYAVFGRGKLAYAVSTGSRWAQASPWPSYHGGPRCAGTPARLEQTPFLISQLSTDATVLRLGIFCGSTSTHTVLARSDVQTPGRVLHTGSTENGVWSFEVPVQPLALRMFFSCHIAPGQ